MPELEASRTYSLTAVFAFLPLTWYTGMKTMGLGHGALLTSWYITYAILAFIQSIIITIVTSRNIFQHSDKGIIFVLFFLFGLSTMALCLLVRRFDSLATRACVAASLFAAACW